MGFEWDKRFSERLSYLWKLPSGEVVGMARKYGRGRHLIQFGGEAAFKLHDDMSLFYALTNYGKGGKVGAGALHYCCGPFWEHAKAVDSVVCEPVA